MPKLFDSISVRFQVQDISSDHLYIMPSTHSPIDSSAGITKTRKLSPCCPTKPNNNLESDSLGLERPSRTPSQTERSRLETQCHLHQVSLPIDFTEPSRSISSVPYATRAAPILRTFHYRELISSMPSSKSSHHSGKSDGNKPSPRTQRPIRQRIHTTCHQCGTRFGLSRECRNCGHRRCDACPREPDRRNSEGHGGGQGQGQSQGQTT